MSEITDHEGEELHLVHVLPYRILSNEYGDYAYTEKHDAGELVSATLPELAEKLRALTVKHVIGWVVPEDKNGNTWGTKSFKIPALGRFKFRLDSNDCYTDFAGKIAVAPYNGATYVALGTYRVEMRREHGTAPDLPANNFGFETIIPSLEEALTLARERTEANLAKTEEAARVATEARKRAELAKLKAELGEG